MITLGFSNSFFYRWLWTFLGISGCLIPLQTTIVPAHPSGLHKKYPRCLQKPALSHFPWSTGSQKEGGRRDLHLPEATAFCLCSGLLLNQIFLQPNVSRDQVFCTKNQALYHMDTHMYLPSSLSSHILIVDTHKSYVESKSLQKPVLTWLRTPSHPAGCWVYLKLCIFKQHKPKYSSWCSVGLPMRILFHVQIFSFRQNNMFYSALSFLLLSCQRKGHYNRAREPSQTQL